MAKADLIMEVVELATKLGKTVETDGLKVEELETMLAELKAEDAPEEQVTPPTPSEGAKRGPKAAYIVAEGKAITSARGVLGAGEGVSEKDLAGGKDAAEALVKSGHLKKG